QNHHVTVDTLTRMAATLNEQGAIITDHIHLLQRSAESALGVSQASEKLPICKVSVSTWLMKNEYTLRSGQITLAPDRSELIGTSERFHKHLLRLIYENPGARFINMDQTSVITDESITKRVCRSNSRTPTVRGNSKRAATFILAITLKGSQLPPCIIET